MNMNKSLTLLLAAGMIVCTAISQYLIYFYAPVEQVLGYAQKIFYYHLPVAWWSFVSFFLAAVFGIAYLLKKNLCYDRISHACAEVGFLLATLTLITGSIWGRHSWGVWWTWDPKLTTALVLWFIFAAYLIIRTMPMPREQKGNISAVVAVIGFLDVPLVFFATRLWRSIHPAVFHSEGGGLEPEMVHTIIFCVLSFVFVWASLLIFRIKQMQQEHRLETVRTKILYQEEQSEQN